MKKQKANKIGRAVLRQLQTAKIAAPRKRPLHVHIALHPMSILMLLCLGVLLISFTLNALADSYTVTAVIPAPPLTSPATITSLATGARTGSPTIAVTGICPSNSYVDLTDNSRFTGEVTCSSGNYRIGFSLVPGVNRLQVQDYNITNDPGPTSDIITITYVPGGSDLTGSSTEPSPVYALSTVIVTQVDNNVPYTPTGTMTVSSRPTFAGVAPPQSHVVVAVQSQQNSCSATANMQGYWSCTISSLSVGTHAFNVTATTADGAQLSFPLFSASVAAIPVAAVIPLTPLILNSSYSYTSYIVGQTVTYTVSVSGGRLPYAMVVTWGDGSTDLALRQAAGTYKLTHTYGWINAPKSTKTVQIQVIDAAGQTALLQLDTVVRNPAYSGAIANITRTTGLWGVFNAMRPWLWLLWPGYLIVLLLVFSFWLGEHQEMILIRKKRRMAAIKGKRRHVQAHR